MKILIQTMNFHPELTGIGKYAGEMAEWLSENGHQIRVVTTSPYYPMWKVDPGYNQYFWKSETWRRVRIYRCPIWVPLKPNGVKRLLHLASFAVSSFPVMLYQIIWRPDIVFTIEPPLFSAPTALLVSWASQAKSILHIQDFEVDAAFNLGLLNGIRLKKIVNNIEGMLLRKFTLVSSISKKMTERAVSKGVDPKRTYLFPNWVDIQPRAKFSDSLKIQDFEFKNDYRKSLNIPDDSIVAMYSGNMGAKQGLEMLSQVVKRFHPGDPLLPSIHFIFCGHGVGRDKLQKECEGFSFVHFLDLQPAQNLTRFLSMADIHLLPQRASAADLVMPSKLAGILASGKPVIACANRGTELADTLDSRGWVVAPEDSEAFYNALIRLVNNKNLRLQLGSSGYDYAVANLDKKKILKRFNSKIIEIDACK